MISQLIEMLDSFQGYVESGEFLESPNLQSQIMLADALKEIGVEDALAKKLRSKQK